MTARDSGLGARDSALEDASGAAARITSPDELEVAPGTTHEKLEGLVWQAASDADLREGLEKAFDYRGDITITKKDGSIVAGYLFDRRTGSTLADSVVRLYPATGSGKIAISYAEIAGLAFTGRDPAAGKSWEAWVRKYWEKKQAGETGIGLVPESLE